MRSNLCTPSYRLPKCLLLATAAAFVATLLSCSRYPRQLIARHPALGTPTPVQTEHGEVVAPDAAHNTESYERIYENDFLATAQHPLSTFAIDVDTAAYSNVRRFLRSGQAPPPGAVRIEELINYFGYDYPQPKGEHPFSLVTEVSACPWNRNHRLLHVGLQGRQIDAQQIPPRNLVFLLDVSGSMYDANKLPLLQASIRLLVDQLRAEDTIAIVAYAGASGVVLPPTPGRDKQRILGAIAELRAGGSTNGAAGIELAYALARQHFDEKGINRVVLATDGDFNVGVTSQSALVRLIERERETGVYLTVFGFGTGNYKDSTMEKLADKGNGNYAYIDSLAEARKVLVKEAGSTLVTIAKDVKIQIEFNPTRVKGYRLIGYENRLLKAEDFDDDDKDAGELGAGHTVTALYEVVPASAATTIRSASGLRYQAQQTTAAAASDELMTIKLRYKSPNGGKSRLVSAIVADQGLEPEQTSTNFRFSASVAAFGMLLRNSKHAGKSSYALVRELGSSSLGQDPNGYRAEFLELVKRAEQLKAL
jgi:Ca-activated chloride channel family protein